MNTTQLLLIDLSAIAHQLFHVSGNEPDPNFISTGLIARVRALATEHPHAAVCCDSGKSFRKDLDPTYKAQRDTENRSVIKHQMTLACETLAADGFPVWASAGYEADDIIATATREALEMDPDVSVLIASADKDLLQLVNGRVTMKKTTDGNIVDADAVVAKFGVTPAQMTDYLCLVGDASDNIKGASGIGGVKASALLKAHGSLQAVYDAMAKGVVNGITPALRTSLMEFRERWPLAKSLIELKSDAPIPFAEIAAERTATDTPVYQDTDDAREQVESIMGAYDAPKSQLHSAGNPPDGAVTAYREAAQDAARALTSAAESGTITREQADKAMAGHVVLARAATEQQAMTPVALRPDVLPPPVADFSLQLEPRTPEEAAKLAGHLFASRLFSAYGTWQGVLSTVLAGRELGIPALAALRAFHIIENRPCLSADTLAALVLKSGKAKFFRVTKRAPEAAAFKTQRVDDDEPIELVYTIEEARAAWKKDQKAWDASGWGKNPADMLIARAKSKLARLVYPDVVGGLYAVEEME